MSTPSDLDAIATELRSFIQRQFGVPEDDPYFGVDVNLYDFGYIDSLGALDLASFIEESFGLRLEDSDWIEYPLNTIREISGFIQMRRDRGA
jgi:methoxymalonate biosynthesis acyl carrier protein